jgi:hypothetical protein
MANQTLASRNFGHDESVRPGLLFFYDALGLGIAWSALVVSTGVGVSNGVPRWVWVPIAFLIVGLVVLMNAGWYVGLVPFAVTNTADLEAPASSGPSEMDLAVRVTGVIENDNLDQRRYRNRPARLTGTTLSVRPTMFEFSVWSGRRVGKAPVRPDLATWTGLGIERGTAYLVTGTRPALRFAWKYGPLILAFESATDRDLAFGFLSARWSNSGVVGLRSHGSCPKRSPAVGLMVAA